MNSFKDLLESMTDYTYSESVFEHNPEFGKTTIIELRMMLVHKTNGNIIKHRNQSYGVERFNTDLFREGFISLLMGIGADKMIEPKTVELC
jgi:hypothetical protein